MENLKMNTTEKRRIAPWRDYKGTILYEGDIILHPGENKDSGVIEYWEGEESINDAWRVRYTDGEVLRLCLQIGDKGQAIKKEPNSFNSFLKELIANLDIKKDLWYKHISTGNYYYVESISLMTGIDSRIKFSINYYEQEDFVKTKDPVIFSREYEDFKQKFELIKAPHT